VSELNTAEIARVARQLQDEARVGVSEGEVLSRDDANGFELGVLATIKTIQAAGGEIPGEDRLVAAIPEGVEATTETVEEVSANFGKGPQGPAGIYVRI
jgi:hypothetical protein